VQMFLALLIMHFKVYPNFVINFFTGLLGTIQLMKKSKECSSTIVTKSCKSYEKDPQTSTANDTVADGETIISGSLPSAKQIWNPSLPTLDKKISVTSASETSVRDSRLQKNQHSVSAPTDAIKTDRTVNRKKQADSKVFQSFPKVTEAAAFHSQMNHQKPHVEHREKGTTHFSHANVKNFQEPLSSNELHILSELALAASMPEEVRVSLKQFIEQQQQSAEARLRTVKTNVEKPKKISEHELEWTYDEVHDPDKLKEILRHVALLLRGDKKKVVEVAAEREWMLKEEAYHASMASFVELCIRTGMVRQE
jgi:hypothetical protein